MDRKEKPAIVTNKHLEYLDGLRESGVVNMFGATPYLRDTFALDITEAKQVLTYWMDTFSERHTEA